MQTAKIFRHGGSQAVRLPAEFRFNVGEVFIWRDKAAGHVVLSTHPASWVDFLTLRDQVLMVDRQEVESFTVNRHDEPVMEADPFAGWRE